ncbi:MAG: Sec-independent protein translocase protein TatB [Burkholderiales bacterium]|nr:Sec-independent protein translocase protein TatB [Burkholderiales bacterium]
MFNFSMGEIGFILIIALVVLGPDKLPQVARTAGNWISKAQRLVSQVKRDIDKEVELSELKKIQEDAKKMASDLESNLRSTQKEIEKEVNSVNDSITKVGEDFQKQVNEASKEIKQATEKVEEAASEVTGTEVPKPEDTLNAAQSEVAGLGEAKVDTSIWDISPSDVDTSSLESAFNWNEPAPVTSTETKTSIPESNPVSALAKAENQTVEDINKLAAEVEKLKALIEGKSLKTKPTRRYATRHAVRKHHITASNSPRIRRTRHA